VTTRTLGTLLAGTTLLLIAACGDTPPERRTDRGGRVSVSLQLNWFPEPEFGGFYEAERAGLFGEAGLDVKLLTGGPSVPAVQLVASGRVPFGIASADQVVQARAQDVPIVALFAVYQHSPSGIMVHASTGITDLAGVFAPRTPKLTLAVMPEPYVTWLKSHYDFSNVKEVAYQGGVSQFVRNPSFAQQCFVTAEPVAAASAGADPRVFLVSDSGFDPYAGVVITREDYLARNEATARAFIDAVRRGWAKYLENPEPANAIMLPLNPGETAHSFAEASRRQEDLIRSDAGLGTMQLERWRTLMEQMVETRTIDEPIEASACFRVFEPAR
jgi:NitT/TauT family transport system substrate-binding protein